MLSFYIQNPKLAGFLNPKPIKQWTNGPTLCPIVWLPYAPEYVDKTSQRGTWLCFVYKCLTSDLSGDLCALLVSIRGQKSPKQSLLVCGKYNCSLRHHAVPSGDVVASRRHTVTSPPHGVTSQHML